MRIGEYIRSTTLATIGFAGIGLALPSCSNDNTAVTNAATSVAKDTKVEKFQEPLDYENLRASKRVFFARAGLSESLLDDFYNRGHGLVDQKNELKESRDITALRYASVRSLAGQPHGGILEALEDSVNKGILDALLEKSSITKERHKFLSDRLSSYLSDDPISEHYLLQLSEEKEIIEHMFEEGLIDQSIKDYFNSEAWFRQFEKPYELKLMAKMIKYEIEKDKLDSSLVNILFTSKDYDLTQRVLGLYIAGEIKKEELVALVGKINKVFANAILDYQYENIFDARARFESRHVLPLVIEHHKNSRRSQPHILAEVERRNQKILTTGRGYSGDHVKRSFADLGVDYYHLLKLKPKP